MVLMDASSRNTLATHALYKLALLADGQTETIHCTHNQCEAGSYLALEFQLKIPDYRQWRDQNNKVGDERDDTVTDKNDIGIQTLPRGLGSPELFHRPADEYFHEGNDDIIETQEIYERLHREYEVSFDPEDALQE